MERKFTFKAATKDGEEDVEIIGSEIQVLPNGFLGIVTKPALGEPILKGGINVNIVRWWDSTEAEAEVKNRNRK